MGERGREGGREGGSRAKTGNQLVLIYSFSFCFPRKTDQDL